VFWCEHLGCGFVEDHLLETFSIPELSMLVCVVVFEVFSTVKTPSG